MTFFVRITPRSPRERLDGALYAFDLSEAELLERVVQPYRDRSAITLDGRTLPADGVSQLDIIELGDTIGSVSLEELRERWAAGRRRQIGDWLVTHAPSVTDRYVRGAPGGERDEEQPTPHATGLSEPAGAITTGAHWRPTLWGRLRVLPRSLAVLGDLITIGLFVVLIVGVVIKLGHHAGNRRHGSSSGTTAIGTSKTSTAESLTPTPSAGETCRGLEADGVSLDDRPHGFTQFVDSPGELGGGSAFLEATLRPHGHYVNVLHAKPGDTIELSLELMDPDYSSVPSATVAVHMGAYHASCWKLLGTASWRSETHGTSRVGPTFVVLPPREHGMLAYVPGSTRLLDQHDKLISRLPDGIFRAQIHLPYEIPPASVDVYYVNWLMKLR